MISYKTVIAYIKLYENIDSDIYTFNKYFDVYYNILNKTNLIPYDSKFIIPFVHTLIEKYVKNLNINYKKKLYYVLSHDYYKKIYNLEYGRISIKKKLHFELLLHHKEYNNICTILNLEYNNDPNTDVFFLVCYNLLFNFYTNESQKNFENYFNIFIDICVDEIYLKLLFEKMLCRYIYTINIDSKSDVMKYKILYILKNKFYLDLSNKIYCNNLTFEDYISYICMKKCIYKQNAYNIYDNLCRFIYIHKQIYATPLGC